MHELHAHRELHPALALVAAHAGGGDGEHRPEPLAARIDQVAGDFRDELDVRAGPRQDDLVDALHRLPRQPHQRLDAGAREPLAFVERNDNAQIRRSIEG